MRRYLLRGRRRSRGGDVIHSKRQVERLSSATLRLVDERDGPSLARQLTDEELVSALRADDREAPSLLWARCSPAVGRLLAKALGPGLDIDDLTQEVFARVFVRLPSLRDPSALRPFVLAVAANVIKWELRRRWVGRKVRLSVTGKLPDVQGASADTEARQALRRCYRIFDSFRTQERMAFVLRFLEEMTIEEVAATLETSVSSAKRWVNRAARKMSARMARDPDLRHFFAGVPEGRE